MFAMGQTFHPTQSLVDILKKLYPRFDQPNFATTSTLLSSSRTETIHENVTDSETPAFENTQDDFILDKGTNLLILSCYDRIVDIYEFIFHHLQSCVQHSITPLHRDKRPFSFLQSRSVLTRHHLHQLSPCKCF
jgi:hypothetical protein